MPTQRHTKRRKALSILSPLQKRSKITRLYLPSQEVLKSTAGLDSILFPGRTVAASAAKSHSWRVNYFATPPPGCFPVILETVAMRMTILASGSRGNSAVLSSSNVSVLVDAGLSCKETLKRMYAVGEDRTG